MEYKLLLRFFDRGSMSSITSTEGTSMHYRPLGHTGIKVSPYALGSDDARGGHGQSRP
jgi:hypothetical protein